LLVFYSISYPIVIGGLQALAGDVRALSATQQALITIQQANHQALIANHQVSAQLLGQILRALQVRDGCREAYVVP